MVDQVPRGKLKFGKKNDFLAGSNSEAIQHIVLKLAVGECLKRCYVRTKFCPNLSGSGIFVLIWHGMTHGLLLQKPYKPHISVFLLPSPLSTPTILSHAVMCTWGDTCCHRNRTPRSKNYVFMTNKLYALGWWVTLHIPHGSQVLCCTISRPFPTPVQITYIHVLVWSVS